MFSRTAHSFPHVRPARGALAPVRSGRPFAHDPDYCPSVAGPRTTVEIAQDEGLPIGLTQEMVDEVERDGEICRDAGGSGVAVLSAWAPRAGGEGSGGEVRWWPNVFKGYVWDGQKY